MAEFTGERVIPGEVDVDLLNEHVARYAFAARLARGKRVLDAGCGGGRAKSTHASAFRNWRAIVPEFTGERVIPGEVDVDLFNGHLAPYAFATRLARGKRMLDAGCGSGYQLNARLGVLELEPSCLSLQERTSFPARSMSISSMSMWPRYAFAARSLWAGCGAACQINTRLGVSELESHRA